MRERRARLGEFDLIADLFAPLARNAAALGLKDDVAWLAGTGRRTLILKTDAVVLGVHALPGDPPALIAAKAIRRPLSDLAAKGAKPLGYLLTLMVGAGTDPAWLRGFARGLAVQQRRFGLALFGGETVRTPGPTAISIALLGEAPPGRPMLRGGARAGDDIWVSGTIGDAAFGLLVLQGKLKGLGARRNRALARRYRVPEPRLNLGARLAGTAHAAVDVSDGLVADLGHICGASRLAATVEWPLVPLSPAVHGLVAGRRARRRICLTGGDDYEILFAAPPRRRAAVLAAGKAAGVKVSRIGRLHPGRGVTVRDENGAAIAIGRPGWRHF